MSGPRILKNYDMLVALTKALRERIELADARRHVLLVDGAALFGLLEGIRKGTDIHEFDAKSANARIAMVRAGKNTTLYAPDVTWKPASN